MFYSHEVLTSKKYGVAIVWLMATVGASGRERKKLNKTEILRVNVPKACETITSEETPLALRLQSNLLFGVSRVYSQQCTFVLSDAENVRVQLRNAMKVLRAGMTISNKGHVAKRDQIMLSDDPHLDPDGLMDLDTLPGLPVFDLDLDDAQAMQDSNMFTIERSSQNQLVEEEDPLTEQLEFSSQHASSGFGVMSGNSPARGSSVSSNRHLGSTRLLGSHLFTGDNSRMPAIFDAGFTFDENGELVDNPPDSQRDKTPSVLTTGLTRNIPTMSEQQEAPRADDYDMPIQDDIGIYQAAEAFPTRQRQDAQPSEQPADRLAEETESEISVVTTTRPQRKARVLPLDQAMELSNSAIAEASRNFASLRLQEADVLEKKRSYFHAVANAKVWLSNALIPRLGDTGTSTAVPSPLAALSLDSFARITSAAPPVSNSAARKRARSASHADEADGSSEQKRQRAEQGSEIGRAGPTDPGLEDDPLMFDDQTLEVGREGGTPLADGHSSTAQALGGLLSSLRGSSARGRTPLNLGGGAGAVSSSVVRGAASLGVRGSSVAPSPLRAYPRGSTGDALGAEDGFQLTAEDGPTGDAAPGVGTGTGPRVQESQNVDVELFLEVLQEMSAQRMERDDDGEEVVLGFEEVIAPETNSRAVATGAFVSLLMLGGRSLVAVRQDQSSAFMPIGITVA